MSGVKETKELISMISVLADCLKEAKKDGKINLFDIPKLAPMIPAIRDGLNGAEAIKLEVKDLSVDEISELLSLSVSAVYALVSAIFEIHG